MPLLEPTTIPHYSILREKAASDPIFRRSPILREPVKILGWDRSGFCLWYKRLERGVFHLPVAAGRAPANTPDWRSRDTV
jgi:IS66 Orf2 like protein